MPTPSSSSTSYADTDDIMARIDCTLLGRLCADGGQIPSAAELIGNARLQAALLDASGQVEAACGIGDMYSPTDLAALTGASLGYLKRLVCSLAVYNLWYSRIDREGDPPKVCEWAMEQLEAIRLGHAVFGLQEQKDAAVTNIYVETAADVEDRNMLTLIADRLFATRVNRLNG